MNKSAYYKQLKERSETPLNLGEFQLWEIFYPEDLYMRKHSHGAPYFSFVLEGGYSEKLGSRVSVRQSGDLIVHTAQESHSVRFHDRLTRIFEIDLSDSWIGSNPELANAFGDRTEFRGGELGSIAARMYGEFLKNDPFSPLAIKGLVFELVAGTAREKSSETRRGSAPKWLTRVDEMLREGFADKILLEDIAEEAGVHPAHLSREFRRRTGCTVGERVRRLRIDEACRKLAETDLDLAAIGALVGFYDQSHFSANFKRLTGFTPGEYRSVLRRDQIPTN